MARRRTCTVSGFEQAMTGLLKEYQQDVAEGNNKLVKDVANRTRNAVSSNISTAGIGGTTYKNSIKVKMRNTRLLASATIYSPRHYRLTHLLENGHNWVIKGKLLDKKYPAHEHWKQAEEVAIQEMENGIKRVVSS